MNRLNSAELCFSYMVYVEDYRTNTDLIISLSKVTKSAFIFVMKFKREFIQILLTKKFEENGYS